MGEFVEFSAKDIGFLLRARVEVGEVVVCSSVEMLESCWLCALVSVVSNALV